MIAGNYRAQKVTAKPRVPQILPKFTPLDNTVSSEQHVFYFISVRYFSVLLVSCHRLSRQTVSFKAHIHIKHTALHHNASAVDSDNDGFGQLTLV